MNNEQVTEVAVKLEKKPFLQTLKQSTTELHLLLESNKLLSEIVLPGISIYQYGYYLTLMNEITSVYEKEILPIVIEAIPNVTSRNISQLILDDLQSIAFKLPDAIKLTQYTISANISTPFAMGFMYVMEGSKLGGKVIFKNIHKVLGFREDFGATYLTDHGVDTFGLWKEFLLNLTKYVTDNDFEEETILGAKYAFKSIYDHFEMNYQTNEI